MASSDGECETTCDSTEETEDDKMFSKITKENTEFNSDNANLLQKKSNTQNGEDVSKTGTGDRKLGGKILRRSANVSQMSKIDRGSQEKRATLPTKSKREEAKEKLSAENNSNDEPECGNKDIECGTSEPKNIDTPVSKNLVGINANQTAHSRINNDSINVAITSDKTNQAATGAGEVTFVKKSVSEVGTKNSLAFINGALPDLQNSPADGGEGKKKPGMLSDAAEENTWQERNSPESGSNEWQEGNLPGQILQAINTSLTNRQQMKEEEENMERREEMNSIDEKFDQNGTIQPVRDDGSEEERADCSTDDAPLNVEPRASFLHGIVSNGSASSKPSAIYGPASDLFISRSDSSSSSSSDELRKSQISINVIVNGEKSVENESEETENVDDGKNETKFEDECIKIDQAHYKPKPKIPAKPSKQVSESNSKQHENNSNSKCNYDNFNHLNKRKSESDIVHGEYYSSVIEEPEPSTLIDHYAESNIYHEVNIDSKIQEHELTMKSIPVRESKLAALAMELEQVRHCNGNMKRQAPLPPKIPDPPLEDPPSCADKNSSPVATHTFSSFKGEVATFSSASSTTSNSSQDTETGYASWNLNGYNLTDEQPPKYPKTSKSSFLLTQYSKCKQMAINYAEDGARARKKFSIKKLLKIRKESETPGAFDPNCPNPKAWKYNDHFEKPRAKLEIIHPMDLEIKSVTVNPGFDSVNTGSVRSFTSSTDDLSFRNSISSDYGSYYSDTLVPTQESKLEVNYEYIQPRIPQEDDSQHVKEESCSTTSPTPSRSSVSSSQASSSSSNTSSKNGTTHRPPKPPPPPRAHSLLPGNKVSRNSDGTYKFPVSSVESLDSDVSLHSPGKPQAPRRQCKTSAPKLDSNFEDQKITTSSSVPISTCISSEAISISSTEILHCDISNSGSYNSATFSVQMSSVETQDKDLVKEENSEENLELENNCRSDDAGLDSSKNLMESRELPTFLIVNKNLENSSCVSNSELIPSASITISSTKISEVEEKSSLPAKAKCSPITKAPARPPPIYSKPISVNFVKNPKPWKTLEDSYLVLSSSNKELLLKLVNQALKRRKDSLSVFRRMQFQWSDFEIDASQPSSVFAFGEKIAYHATMPNHKKCSVTLVITIQEQQNRFQDGLDFKYPVLGQFTDFIPSDLLDNSCDAELDSMQARVLVLSHSNITTIECYTENLPESLTEENEKELCFIILQLIQSLKSLQAQGIESMDTSFQNLILAKTTLDRYYTLIFLYDSCYDENDYSSDTNRISLCQYALSLLFQMLKIQSAEEFQSISSLKFSSTMTRKVYQAVISVLSEEKAISLSQTKVLLECFLWGITKVIESSDDADDIEAMFHRWIDIERSNYVKNMVNDEPKTDINTQNEYFSQFLIRTSVRNIREVLSIL
ncbi:uncharacterized protein LOC129225677 [Uloborus diversus]|uniref:uncharacterized protein LOC129225677 n=1 Tax=Uloborus diversus TaxID=327109 RepID=UPI00240932E7|nr:uncharacterized protein LOC129225677 [Uloborus diversus]